MGMTENWRGKQQISEERERERERISVSVFNIYTHIHICQLVWLLVDFQNPKPTIKPLTLILAYKKKCQQASWN